MYRHGKDTQLQRLDYADVRLGILVSKLYEERLSMIIKNESVMKSLFYRSFIYALLSYAIFVTTFGMFIVRDEMKDFSLASMRLEKYISQTVMMSLLMESELKRPESQMQSVENMFEGRVYVADDAKLLPEEEVARAVLQKVSTYMSDIVEDDNAFIYYLSYSGEKYIFAKEVKDINMAGNVSDKERCDHAKFCSIYSWPDQLSDKVIITPPYFDTITNKETISITSPVYKDGNIEGEYVTSVNIDGGYMFGAGLETSVDGGIRYIELAHGNYPFQEIAFTRSYIADNKTVFMYSYPLSKLLLKYSWAFFFAFTIIALLEYNRTLARTRKKELDIVETSAVVDELTGVYNRKIYRKAAFQKAINDNDCIVIAIDGNRIKQINDQHGHHIGDEAIRAISRAMQQTFRKSDYLIRTGGDEFIAILPSCSADRAIQLCEVFNEKLSSFKLPISGLRVTASCGVASKYISMSLKEAIMKADENLYQKKGEL